MPTNTPNLNLIKPLVSEKYTVAVANANNDLIDSVVGSINNLTSTTLRTAHTQTESIKSLPTGSLDGKVSKFKADGLSLVNSVSGSNVANGASVSFLSVLNNIYYSSFTNTKITGTGSTITITNNSGATVNIIVINMTALGIASYTEAQMLDFVHGGYFDGLKGVENPTFESVGKNLFDKTKATLGFYLGTNGVTVATTSGVGVSDFIKVKPSQTYKISGVTLGASNQCYYDSNKVFISYVQSSSLTTPANCFYVRLTLPTLLTIADSVQLEQGTVATAYEPYKSSALSIQETLRSLPNGVKDKAYEQDGQIWLEKNVAEYTLKSTDIISLTTTGTNTDFATFNLSVLNGSISGNGTLINGYAIPQGYIKEVTVAERDLTSAHYSHNYGSTTITLNFPKSTYASLASAQTALAGTKIHYQLATPQLINLTALGKADGELSSFANGTSILDADTFHSPSVQFSVPSNTGAQISALLESANAQAKQIEAIFDLLADMMGA